LRHHRELSTWAAEHGDAVIVADRLAFEGVDALLSFRARAGDRVELVGSPADRRIAAATLSGHLPPRSGQALVAGAVLPSEASRAMRRVTVIDLDGARIAPTVTIGDLVRERLAVAPRTARSGSPGAVSRWMQRTVGSAERHEIDSPTLANPATPVASLPPRERAVLLAAIATIDQTPVIVLDLPEGLLAPREVDALDAVVAGLGQPGVVRVWAQETATASGAILAQPVVAAQSATAGRPPTTEPATPQELLR
jgi:putative drug exporter of the RND superfamily